MQMDVKKREMQEEQILTKIEQIKPKIDEEELIKTFNRLILDANRRMEAKNNIDQMKLLLEEKFNNGKKYSTDEWMYIYNDRFLKYIDDRNKKIEEQLIEKKKKKKKKKRTK